MGIILECLYYKTVYIYNNIIMRGSKLCSWLFVSIRTCRIYRAAASIKILVYQARRQGGARAPPFFIVVH